MWGVEAQGHAFAGYEGRRDHPCEGRPLATLNVALASSRKSWLWLHCGRCRRFTPPLIDRHPVSEGWWVGVDVGLVAPSFGGDGVVVLLASGACAEGHGQAPLL